MKRWRERKRDDLLRRGPRLARRPSSVRSPATLFSIPSTDPRRVYRCAFLLFLLPRPSLPRRPFLLPLHDPRGCDCLLPLLFIRPFPHPSYLPYDASAATRQRTRTLGAPLLLAADAKAAQRCRYMEGCEGGSNQASFSRQLACGSLP